MYPEIRNTAVQGINSQYLSRKNMAAARAIDRMRLREKVEDVD
jgi:hypothetical protein